MSTYILSNKQKDSNLENYLKTIKPLNKTRVNKVLSTYYNYSNETLTESQFIQKCINNGLKFFWRFNSNKTKEYYVKLPSNSNLLTCLTKTAYEYAKYLGGKVMSKTDEKKQTDYYTYIDLMKKFQHPTIEMIQQKLNHKSKWRGTTRKIDSEITELETFLNLAIEFHKDSEN
jgi:hypothetical protein